MNIVDLNEQFKLVYLGPVSISGPTETTGENFSTNAGHPTRPQYQRSSMPPRLQVRVISTQLPNYI